MHNKYVELIHKYVEFKLKFKSTENVFTDIFIGNEWGGHDSVSGRGSDTDQTRVITSKLPIVFCEFNIETILDIPCDDFYWMNNIDMEGFDYIGADIVLDLIQMNSQKFAKDNIHFCKLNLIEDSLPKVDLIFCRDCFVHFSFEDIFLALHNICDSGSTYFLTTTFADRQHNPDIITGQWRPLNIEINPFIFPLPLTIINEECTEGGGAFQDKSLGLYRIADIKASLITVGKI